MPLIYRARDDIFDTPGLDIIVNYPTLDPGWDKGLPAVFKARYPKMYEQWDARLTIGEDVELGKAYLWEEEGKPAVINVPLKRHYQDGQRPDILWKGMKNLKRLISTKFNPHRKVVMPIIVNNDGVGFMLDALRQVLETPDYLFEVSLSPFRFQGNEASRKVYYLNWDSPVSPELKLPLLWQSFKEYGIHSGNTQTIITDPHVYDAMVESDIGFNLGNPLLHITLQKVPTDQAGWLKEKGLDGVIQVSGDAPVISLLSYD